MSTTEQQKKPVEPVEDDDEPDEWWANRTRMLWLTSLDLANGQQGQANLQYWMRG